MAYKMLNHAHIQRRIAELKKSAEETTGISLPFVIGELLNLSGGMPVIVFDSREQINALPQDQKDKIKAVEVVEENKGTARNPIYYRLNSKWSSIVSWIA